MRKNSKSNPRSISYTAVVEYVNTNLQHFTNKVAHLEERIANLEAILEGAVIEHNEPTEPEKPRLNLLQRVTVYDILAPDQKEIALGIFDRIWSRISEEAQNFLQAKATVSGASVTYSKMRTVIFQVCPHHDCVEVRVRKEFLLEVYKHQTSNDDHNTAYVLAANAGWRLARRGAPSHNSLIRDFYYSTIQYDETQKILEKLGEYINYFILEKYSAQLPTGKETMLFE